MQTGCSSEQPTISFAIEGLLLRILILEDCPIQIDILTDKLKILFNDTLSLAHTDKLANFKNLMVQEEFDLFIVDLNVLDAKAAEVSLALLQFFGADRRKVIIHTSESWASIMKSGLDKFLIVPKGVQTSTLRTALEELEILI